MAGTFEAPMPLSRVYQDYLDQEWYDKAVSMVSHMLVHGLRPSADLVEQLVALSLCSLPAPIDDDDEERPSDGAIRTATHLLTRLGAVPQQAELASWALASLPSFRNDSRRASVASESSAWLNTVEKWAKERMHTAVDVWDLLSNGHTATTRRDERPPRQHDEFWMSAKKRKAASKRDEEARRRRKRGKLDVKKGEEEVPQLELTEGAWRTLSALVSLWQAEATSCSLADQFQPDHGYRRQIRTPFHRTIAPDTLSTELGKALDVIFSFPNPCDEAASIAHARTAAGLLVLMHNLGKAKKLDLNAVVQGATTRMGNLGFEEMVYLAKPLREMHPHLLASYLFRHLEGITEPRSASPRKRERSRSLSRSPSKFNRTDSDRSLSSIGYTSPAAKQGDAVTDIHYDIIGRLPSEARLYDVATRQGLRGPVSQHFKLQAKFSAFASSEKAVMPTAMLRLQEMRERLRLARVEELLIQTLMIIEAKSPRDIFEGLPEEEESDQQRTIRKMRARQAKTLKHDIGEFEACVDEMFRHSLKDVAHLCEAIILQLRQLEASNALFR